MKMLFDAFQTPKTGSGATIQKFAALDPNTGLTSATLEVQMIGTGLTYNGTTGALAGTVNQLVLHDGVSALQTVTLDTTGGATRAAEVTAWLAQANSVKTTIAGTSGVPAFTVLGALTGFGNDATITGATVARAQILNGATPVGFLEFVGTDIAQYGAAANATVSFVRVYGTNGTTLLATVDFSADPLDFSYFKYIYDLSSDDLSIYLMRGNDSITGAINDMTDGVFGDDTLDAGLGADTITGATGGSDTVSYDSAKDAVTVVLNEGATAGRTAGGGNIDGVEDKLVDIENIVGSRYGSDFLTGNSGANIIWGGADNARDHLEGGLGNDTYVLNGGTEDAFVNGATVEGTGDTILDTGGTDTILSTITRDLANYSDVEILTLQGTANINGSGNGSANVINGNSGNNELDGGAFSSSTKTNSAYADTLVGGAGNDTYTVDNTYDVVTETTGNGTDVVIAKVDYTLTTASAVESLKTADDAGISSIKLTGNELAQTITGDKGTNTLNGGTDSLVDTLIGGAGNDTYILGSQTADVITENVDPLLGGKGDTITSTITRTLASFTGIENITLEGGSAANATGNASANLLIGNSAANVLNGLDASDTMTGGLGNDTFFWQGSGSDKITDFTIGSDVIDVTALNIAEFTTLQVLLGTSTTPARFTRMSNGVASTLELTGVAKASLTSSQFVLSTSTTGDTLTGTALTDHLFSGGGNDTVNGGAGSDYLFGETGNDSMDGGAGADYMYGSAGNDTYVVDSTADKIYESAGTDTILTAVTYSLKTTPSYDPLTKVANNQIENLATTNAAGTTAINLTGNDLANSITGNAGANTINGGLGADTMNGGAGNDIYYIDNAGDQISDSAGTDKLYSTVNYTLGVGDAIETLYASGTAAVNITGNDLDQKIVGSAAVNNLDSKLGNDTMTGGGGADNFLFTSTLNATTNKDTITDFNPLYDMIKLDNAVMTALGANAAVLASGKFYIGTAAHDLDDRIIYNKTTGTLTYDSNGSQAGGDTVFAVLTNKIAITYADFAVI